MNSALKEIEERLPALSFQEQLLLLERLASHLRAGSARAGARNAEMDAMASDPDIQREIREIETEFAVALQDGLGDV